MNVVQSALTSSRFNRVFSGLALAVLVAGLVFGIVKVINNGEPNGSGKLPVLATPKPEPVNASVTPFAKLDPAVQSLIKNFILGAVAQKNLAQSYALVDNTLRGGITYKQWKSGTLSFSPIPIDSLKDVVFKVKVVQPRLIAVQATVTPTKKSGIQTQAMAVIVKKFGQGAGSHWLVDYWGSLWVAPLRFVPGS